MMIPVAPFWRYWIRTLKCPARKQHLPFLNVYYFFFLYMLLQCYNVMPCLHVGRVVSGDNIRN